MTQRMSVSIADDVFEAIEQGREEKRQNRSEYVERMIRIGQQVCGDALPRKIEGEQNGVAQRP